MFKSLVKSFVAHPIPEFRPAPVAVRDNVFKLERRVRFPGGAWMESSATLVKLEDDSLVIVSAPPIFDSACVEQINLLGDVKYVVIPNSFHYLFAEKFVERFPDCLLAGPQGYAKRNSQPVLDIELGDRAPSAWPPELEYRVLHAPENVKEIAFFHRPSSTLILTDLAFNFVAIPGRLNRVFWSLSGVPASLGPARTSRRLLLKDSDAASAFLNAILQWPFEAIVFSHGETIVDDAAERFRVAFGSYL